MIGTELKPTNQALLLNKCHCGINPQHTESHKDPTHECSQIKHSNTPLANTPIQRVVLTITDSITEDKRHLAPKAN
jgi:hypothetical protein